MISNNIKIPGHYYHVDPSLAGFDNSTRSVAIIGQKLPEGTAAHNTLIAINNINDITELFGKNSELHKTILAFKEKNTNEQLYAIAVPHIEAYGTATITAEVDSNKIKSGTIKMRIIDTIVDISVGNVETTDNLLSNLAVVINGCGEPVLAEVNEDNDSLKITSKISGENAYYLPIYEISGVSGVTLLIEKFSNLGGNPSYFEAFEIAKNKGINYIISCISEGGSIDMLRDEAAKAFTSTSDTSFRVFIIKNDKLTYNLTSFANKLNSPHFMIIDGYVANNNSIYKTLGSISGEVISMLAKDPSMPTANVAISGLYGQNSRSFDERNLLLNNGISTLDLLPDETVRLNRCVSSYHTNEQGGVDGAYIDIQTAETLARIKELRQETMDKELAGYKLFLNDDDLIDAGIKAMTPATFRSWLVNFYQTVLVAKKGWCQDANNYIKTLQVIKTSDKTRLDYIDQPTLTGGLYITVGTGYFK